MALFDRIRRQVEEFEAEFCHAEVEHGAGWDKQGREIFRREGIFGAVPIYPDEQGLLYDGLLTHVHHNGSSFSDGDLFLTAHINLQEIRVVGIQSERLVVHVLRRTGQAWPLPADEFAALWRESVFRVKDPTRPAQQQAYQRGDVDAMDRILRYDSIQAVTHEIMQALQSHVSGFIYQRLFP